MMKSHKKVVLLGMVIAACALSLGGTLGWRSYAATAQPVSPSPTPSGQWSPVTTRAEAEATFRKNTATAKRVDTVQSKEVHLSDLTAVAPQFADLNGEAGNRLVWVVVMSGDYVPSLPGLPNGAPVPHYPWATSVWGAAADGSSPIGDLWAGNAEPAWFNGLTDIGPA